MGSLRNRINRCRTIVLTQTKVTASRRNHQENKEPNQSQKSVTKESNGQIQTPLTDTSGRTMEDDAGITHAKQ